jgi:uncharacterized Fe-S cluster-containing radical SAM superfamily protein
MDIADSPVVGTNAKFQDPDWTAKGEPRASVALADLRTLWFNTGTLCNITCGSCYIESSPRNDRLVYLSASEVAAFLDEISADELPTREIGFTGGEPFLNPDMIEMLGDTLRRGLRALVLTNGLLPMQRPRVKEALIELNRAHRARMTIRVSLDHYTKALHETERGPRTWTKTLAGIDWLCVNNFHVALAGRTCWGEGMEDARRGYGQLIRERGWIIDPNDPVQLVLLPEMDGSHEVPEITTACWGILNKAPTELMCASSRMIVKRKGADKPVVVPCTLLPYEQAFEMGHTLAESRHANGAMFADGAVKLCHPHCAKFCVLGGGSCS